MCSEPIPPDALTDFGRELADAQASLRYAEAARTTTENKLFSEQCARAKAETWAKQFSADRDTADKEIKFARLLGERRNDIRTKEVNHTRSEYLVGIQALKKSHDSLHKLLSLTDPNESTLTLKLHERNRDLVRRVKRL
ncbi:hypothetical protein PHMEG_00023313 [Phytophthora megakarya]|uniref:Uncharacterized protein n=1 Tax=Phytophthora megakarya TaxID=4795 RepID=A0A225VGJ0_9STRA|nr:hypothetical protein PHMEG_00023313 [Phytophthora megakarya]